MKDDNCIFCKLANGDIPTNTIYEDADFRVILDASPATKGHALILPKQHYANMFEMDDEVLAKAAKLASVVPINRGMLLKLKIQSSLFIMGNANARCNPANASGRKNTVRS